MKIYKGNMEEGEHKKYLIHEYAYYGTSQQSLELSS